MKWFKKQRRETEIYKLRIDSEKNNTAPNLLVYFKLDENTRTASTNEMGIIADGTINGASWTTGKAGSALSQFNREVI